MCCPPLPRPLPPPIAKEHINGLPGEELQGSDPATPDVLLDTSSQKTGTLVTCGGAVYAIAPALPSGDSTREPGPHPTQIPLKKVMALAGLHGPRGPPQEKPMTPNT